LPAVTVNDREMRAGAVPLTGTKLMSSYAYSVFFLSLSLSFLSSFFWPAGGGASAAAASLGQTRY